MSEFAVVTATVTPGGRLSNGSPSGVGVTTTYRAGLTADGRHVRPVGPEFTAPREAHRYAERIERRLPREND